MSGKKSLDRMSWHLVSIWSAVSLACLMLRVAACNFNCDWINSSWAAKILLDAVTTVLCMCWFKWCQNWWLRSTARKKNGPWFFPCSIKKKKLQIAIGISMKFHLAFFAEGTFLRTAHDAFGAVMVCIPRSLLEHCRDLYWRRRVFRRQIRAPLHRIWLLRCHSNLE